MLEPFPRAGLQATCKMGGVKGNVGKGCCLISTKEKPRLVCLPERNQRVSFSHE